MCACENVCACESMCVRESVRVYVCLLCVVMSANLLCVKMMHKMLHHFSSLCYNGCIFGGVGTNVVGAKSLKEMVEKLKKPRKVMMLVKAGGAVDDFIDKLVPLLEKNDIIIDGGNSEYTDSIVSQYDIFDLN